MTSERRRASTMVVLALAVTLAGCSQPVAYQPNDGALDGMTRDQREQIFAETLSRAVKPRIFQVWIDDSSYGYDSSVAVRDGFGIPVAYGGRRRIVYFGNIRELRLFDNHAVFVFDTSGRLIDKIQFGYADDAARMIDLMASYRAQRLAGGGSPGPSRETGHRYDRRYERRSDEPRYEEPRYERPPPPPYDRRYDDYDGPPPGYDDR
jgi:hypothetical protein